MTQDEFDYLNELRNRLAEDGLPMPYRREDLHWMLAQAGRAEDAERVSKLPYFVRVIKENGVVQVEGMSGPGGVIGWLYPDGTCRRKFDAAEFQ